jgi:hypothetical protein
VETNERVAAIEAHRDRLLSRQNRLLNELSLVERQLDDVIHILGRMGVLEVLEPEQPHTPALTLIRGGKP